MNNSGTGIYAYWEGDFRHWYYDLCWETVKLWNPEATLLSKSDVESVIGPIPLEVVRAGIIHQVDWIRKRWIHAVGGLWLDMDFISWSDLSPYAHMASAVDYIGWREWHGTGWMDNFFGGRKGSIILNDAAEHARQQMVIYGKDVPWLATNAASMNYAMERNQWSLWMQIPSHMIGPVAVVELEWFLSCGEINANDFRSVGFMTSMEGLKSWLMSIKTKEEFLAGKTNLAAIIRRGLNK